MTDLLPREVAEALQEFMVAGKTGVLTLDMNRGDVASWKLAEHHRVGRAEGTVP